MYGSAICPVCDREGRQYRAGGDEHRWSLKPCTGVCVRMQPCAVTCGEQQDTGHDGLGGPGEQIGSIVDVGGHATAKSVGNTGDNRVVRNVPALRAGCAAHAEAAQ